MLLLRLLQTSFILGALGIPEQTHLKLCYQMLSHRFTNRGDFIGSLCYTQIQ